MKADEQLGRDEPSVSMDSAGKIVYAKNTEILTANVSNLGADGTFPSPGPYLFRQIADQQVRRQKTVNDSTSHFVISARPKSTPKAFNTVPTADSSPCAVMGNTSSTPH